MAKREPVAWPLICRVCTLAATLELFTRDGYSVGNYCAKCGKRKLKDLAEPETGLTSQ